MRAGASVPGPVTANDVLGRPRAARAGGAVPGGLAGPLAWAYAVSNRAGASSDTGERVTASRCASGQPQRSTTIP